MAEVLLDCGNTSIRVGLLDAGTVTQVARLGDELGFRTWLRALPEMPRAARLAASSESEGTLGRDWCKGQGLPVRVVGEDLALPALGQYPGCGADRVLAGLAACSERPALVVDAGTATTLSAWERHDAGPRFAGGLILPGAQACRRGLSASCPDLPSPPLDWQQLEPRQHATRGALQAALAIGYPAMVRACLEQLARASGIAHIVLTGGAAEPLLEPLEQGLGLGIERRPDLVMEGLALL